MRSHCFLRSWFLVFGLGACVSCGQTRQEAPTSEVEQEEFSTFGVQLQIPEKGPINCAFRVSPAAPEDELANPSAELAFGLVQACGEKLSKELSQSHLLTFQVKQGIIGKIHSDASKALNECLSRTLQGQKYRGLTGPVYEIALQFGGPSQHP